MILLVDDLRSFIHDEFGTVETARTSEQAVELLRKHADDFTSVWLDFDLGEPDGIPDTTLPILDWLIEHKDHADHIHIVIHTSNPVGRSILFSGLYKAGYQVRHSGLEMFRRVK